MDDLDSTKETQAPLVHEGTQTGSLPMGYPGMISYHSDSYDLLVEGRSLKEYPVIIYRHRLLIFALILVGLLLSGLINHVSHRTYTAVSMVNIGQYIPAQESHATRLLKEQTGSRNYVKTQVPLLESNLLARRILAVNPVIGAYLQNPEKFKLADYAEEYKDIIAPATLDLTANNPYSLPSEPEARIELEQKEDQVPIFSIQKYLSMISFSEVKDTTLVKIYTTATRPGMTAVIANAHALAFASIVKEQQQAQANINLRFLEERLIEASEKVEQATAARMEYAKEHNLMTGDTRVLDSTFEAKFRDIIRALNDAIFQKVQLESEYRTLRRQNGFGRVTSDGNASGEAMRLARLESDYDNAIKDLGRSHPQTQFLQGKMQRVKDALQNFGKQQIQDSASRYEMASKKEAALRHEFEMLHEKELKTSKHRVQYDLLSKELLAAEEVQNELSRRLDEAIFAADNTQDTVQIQDPAIVPSRPNGLNESSNLFTGAFLGGVIGILIAFLMDFLDNTIRTERELESAVNTAVLGVIPAFSDSLLTTSNAAAYLESQGHEIPHSLYSQLAEDQVPVLMSAPLSKESEQFRSLFTSVTHASAEHEPRIMLVTSAQQSDGKSTVAANLAVAFAQAGHRTVLIDIDLRLPSVQSFFPGVQSSGGVVNFLSGEDNYHPFVVDSGVENLNLLFAGSQIHNPTAMLRSDRIRELIQLLEAEFEYVIVDSPPIGPCADAQILSRYVDGVIVVVRAGVTPKPVVQSTVHRLVKAHAHIIGAVLNDAKRSDTYRESSYYYMGDGYYNYGSYTGYNGFKNGAAAVLNNPEIAKLGSGETTDAFGSTVAAPSTETMIGNLDEETRKQITQQTSTFGKRIRKKPRGSNFRFTLAHFGVLILAASVIGFLTWSNISRKKIEIQPLPILLNEVSDSGTLESNPYEAEQEGEGYFRIIEDTPVVPSVPDTNTTTEETAANTGQDNSWWVSGDGEKKSLNISTSSPLYSSRSGEQLLSLVPGWYIQVGSHSQKALAEDHLKYFKNTELTAHLFTRQIGSITYYRVMVGPYESEAEAKSIVPEVRRRGLARLAPVTREIK